MEEQRLDHAICRLQKLFGANIQKLSTPNMDISSQMLRGWIAQGRSTRYYLPADVIRYIRQENLYMQGEDEYV